MTSTLAIAAPRRSEDDFVEQLRFRAERHLALNHIWLNDFASGRLPDMRAATRDFAAVHYGYSAWFTRYLRAVIDRLERADHREALLENLSEESGKLDDEARTTLREMGIPLESVDGVPHRELCRRFCLATGLDDAALEAPPPISVYWRYTFLARIEQSPAAFGVGAIGLGTEGIVQNLYAKIIRGLSKAGHLKSEDTVFFDLHCHVDEQHQLDLLRIAKDLAVDDKACEALKDGMLFALDLRCAIWQDLWQRSAMRRTGAMQ